MVDQPMLPFDEKNPFGPAGGRLEAKGAGAGKKVEADEPGDPLPQPVKEGLPYTVWGRAQPRDVGKGDSSAPPITANKTQLPHLRDPSVCRKVPLSPGWGVPANRTLRFGNPGAAHDARGQL